MSVTAYHFWSPSCGPCKIIKPAVEDLKEEFPQVVWVTVNTHEDKESLAAKYGISIVPTIVVESKDATGNVINLDKQVGTTMGGYYRIIRAALRLTQLS